MKFLNKEKWNKLNEVIVKERQSYAMIRYDSFLGPILGKILDTVASIISQWTVAPRTSDAQIPYSVAWTDTPEKNLFTLKSD